MELIHLVKKSDMFMIAHTHAHQNIRKLRRSIIYNWACPKSVCTSVPNCRAMRWASYLLKPRLHENDCKFTIYVFHLYVGLLHSAKLNKQFLRPRMLTASNVKQPITMLTLIIVYFPPLIINHISFAINFNPVSTPLDSLPRASFLIVIDTFRPALGTAQFSSSYHWVQ